jgi:hypothetical protein
MRYMALYIRRYLLVHFLTGYGIPINSAWFQRDGVRPHTKHDVLRFLRNVFEEKVLLNRLPALFKEGFSWPQISPNLHTCDYSAVYLKDRVFQKNQRTIPKLETNIKSETEAISTETLT